MNYFDKLPTITYNGAVCKNLLARAKLSDQTRAQQAAFYPYTMENADRIDTLSNDYYDDPGYTWLIWLTNNIVDPYYDVPLIDDDFYQYVIKKYGSLDVAGRGIKFYRNNWYFNTDEQLSVAQFNSLASSFKKYYEPVLDNNLAPYAFKRKRYDEVVNTNKVLSLSITGLTGTFTVGEEIRVNESNYAFVTYASSTIVTCQHVEGAIAGTNVIVGQSSGASATVSSVTVLAETIAAQDPTYWDPVTFLDYETEQNEVKKTFELLDPRYVNQAETDLIRVMSER